MEMGFRRIAWSDIPPEILSSIVKRLESRIDFFRVRSVCTKWRSSLNSNPNPNPSILSPFLPRKISNTSLPFTDSCHGPLLLVACTVLLVQPLRSSGHSSGWILTVEESNPGKLRILYPLSRNPVVNLPSNFPKSLNLLEFDVSEIDRSYILKFANDGKDVSGVVKVVMCSDRTVMVLYGEGTLAGLRLKNGKWGFVRHSLLCAFTDVITFKGMVWAIDHGRNLYAIDHMLMNVTKTIEVDQSNDPKCHQKLLIEPSGEFCLVVWYPCEYPMEGVVFAVYTLDQMRRKWTSATSLDDRAFFVSMNSCSFKYNGKRRFLGEGYVAYSECCLDLFGAHPIANHKLFQGASVNLHVNVFFFQDDGYDKSCWRESISSIADLLWPPPTWFWPDMCSASGDEEENEQLDFSCDHIQTCSKEILPPPSAVKCQMQFTEIPFLGPFSGASASEAKTAGMDTHAVSTSRNFNISGSTVMHGGAHIRSDLVPTLHKIVAKHGDVVEGSTISNGDMISRALETLATAVLVLQNNSANSLSKTQADYLISALSDLQNMGFKVGWLGPVVEKALALHKGKSLISSLKEYGKAKALAEEMKLKVLDELAKLDEIEEDMTLVFEKIPILESVDLDQCLGDELC